MTMAVVAPTLFGPPAVQLGSSPVLVSTADADVPFGAWLTAAARMWDRVAYCPDDADVARADGVLGGCWWWLGAISSSGHGRATLLPRRVVGTHVLAWVAHADRLVPAGHVVRHRCDEGSCVRPEHLEIGSQLDNVADRVARGRHTGVDVRGPAGRARAVREHLLAHPDDWVGLAAVLEAGNPQGGLTPLPGL